MIKMSETLPSVHNALALHVTRMRSGKVAGATVFIPLSFNIPMIIE
jgi:hypothetical protein